MSNALINHCCQDEIYHPLYVSAWQDTTILDPISPGYRAYFGMSVSQDPDGEFIRYVVYDKTAISQIFTTEGISFPCVIPDHPEHLNDIGILRMHVSTLCNIHARC